jgi:hypothetical protein
MSWFWLNVPLAVLFFAAWSGIPLWMVLRRPDWRGKPATKVPAPAVQAAPADLQAEQVPDGDRQLVGV